MKKKAKALGIAFYFVVRKGQRYGSDPQSQTERFGPYSSMEEASRFKREDEEAAAGEPGWEFTYEIICEPNLLSK